MIKFIPEVILDEISTMVEQLIQQISPPKEEIDIPVIMETCAGYFEDVSDLNGIAIPCLYMDKKMGTHLLYSIVEKMVKPLNDNYVQECFYQIDKESTSINDYLLLANIMISLNEGLYFRLRQIDIYDWLDEEQIEQCFSRLDSTINDNQSEIQVEVKIIQPSDSDANDRINFILSPYFPEKRFEFTAIVDLISDDIWELKCTSSLVIDNFLQLIIYAWIWRVIYPNEPKKECKLFNIRTGELYWLKTSSVEELTPIIVKILEAKYVKNQLLTDDKFIEENIKNNIYE
jgi:hypothetical protein